MKPWRSCLFLIAVFFFACKKEKAEELPPNVGGFLQSGTWRVRSFNQPGEEPVNFSAYAFTFDSLGRARATDSAGTVSGSWGSTVEGMESRVVFQFAEPRFQGLSRSWTVLEATAARVDMRHGGNGGAEAFLVMERN